MTELGVRGKWRYSRQSRLATSSFFMNSRRCDWRCLLSVEEDLNILSWISWKISIVCHRYVAEDVWIKSQKNLQSLLHVDTYHIALVMFTLNISPAVTLTGNRLNTMSSSPRNYERRGNFTVKCFPSHHSTTVREKRVARLHEHGKNEKNR